VSYRTSGGRTAGFDCRALRIAKDLRYSSLIDTTLSGPSVVALAALKMLALQTGEVLRRRASPPEVAGMSCGTGENASPPWSATLSILLGHEGPGP
jgi:hypothetical protein